MRRKSTCILLADLEFHLRLPPRPWPAQRSQVHLHCPGAVHRVRLDARAWQTAPRAAVLRPRAVALRPEADPQGGGLRRATQGPLRWDAGPLATAPPPVSAPARTSIVKGPHAEGTPKCTTRTFFWRPLNSIFSIQFTAGGQPLETVESVWISWGQVANPLATSPPPLSAPAERESSLLTTYWFIIEMTLVDRPRAMGV